MSSDASEQRARHTLEELLRRDLPALVPTDPSRAITGTAIIAALQTSHREDYKSFADASIAQYLSGLTQDRGPGNPPLLERPAARGYILRRADAEEAPADDAHEEVPGDEPGPAVDQAGAERQHRNLLAEERFRAIFMKAELLDESRYSIKVRHEAAERQRRRAGRDVWKFPDVILLEWLIAVDENRRFVRGEVEIRGLLAEPMLAIMSTELKVSTSRSEARMQLMQCVANSRWANRAILAIAGPIDDNDARAELVRLGSAHAVEVRSYGLAHDLVASAPEPAEILAMSAEAFDRFRQDHLRWSGGYESLTPAKRSNLDWSYLADLRGIHPDFRALCAWIAACVESKRAIEYEEWRAEAERSRAAG